MDEKQSEKHRSIVVRRRLDRTPDKLSRKLKDKEKSTITTLRTALEEAKLRSEKLKDENELKDSFIEEEKQLRIKAESRLEALLVDLYKNPQVNWELRQRLPRANKMDPMETKPRTFSITTHDIIWEPFSDADQSHQEGPLTSHSATSIDSYQSLPSVNQTTDSYQSPHAGTRMTDSYQSLPSVNQTTDSYQSPHAGTRMTDSYQSLPSVSQDNVWQSTRPGYFLPETLRHTAVHNTAVHDTAIHADLQDRQFHPHPPKSSVSHPPKSSVSHPPKSSVSHPPKSSVSHPPKSSVSHPPKSSESHPPKSSESHPPKSSVSHPPKSSESHPPKSSVSHPLNYKFSESSHLHSAQRDSTSLVSQVPPDSLVSQVPSDSLVSQVPSDSLVSQVPSDSLVSQVPSDSLVSQVTSDVSHISRVLAELAMVKKENQTLKEELKSAQLEIQKLKTKQENSLENIGGLIEELRSAEKQREAALVMMVQSAEADKMAALGDLTRISSKYESCYNNVGESELSQLVARQREIMQEEMQGVLEQRDEARQKVVQLEKQLSSLELSGHYSPDNKLLVKLQITRDERDKLVQKLNLLLQEIGETKLVYNLHKALLSDSGDGVKNNVVSEMLRYKDGRL
ncbi:uncharacterized protein LOC131935720 isoform X2 [Physella acuta]|uniref:uncharacterized protein LOC131935720 isoform X2 n=1 Tax=Physella acuta TaxID=109671 RepID=UPI0027DE8D1E|nr:uncharacterized protein LOC131935720 isoform X2 [Physella acuta]